MHEYKVPTTMTITATFEILDAYTTETQHTSAIRVIEMLRSVLSRPSIFSS